MRLIVRAIAVRQRRAARAVGVRNGEAGASTFVQRFGGLLNLNVHDHLVVPDGVFVADEDTGELSLLRLLGSDAKIEFTRARPYKKNDQAWVEQKNGSVVRRLVGYRRLAGMAAADTP